MAYSKLKTGSDNFHNMMKAFGVVTVMNAKIFEIDEDGCPFAENTAEDIRNYYLGTQGMSKLLATIDTLKVANITIEGPNKTVTGGQYSNPLIKFGKSARLEMQDALGRADAIEAFGGAVNEYTSQGGSLQAMHVTEDFAPVRLIIGDSFFISKDTGQQVKVNIIFYQVLPDSIFNLSQDAEGDATVFDMNADLLTTTIMVAYEDNDEHPHGVFYSVVEDTTVASAKYNVTATKGVVSVTGPVGVVGVTYKYSVDGGLTWEDLPSTSLANHTIDIRGIKDGDNFVVAENYFVPAE